MVGYRFAGTLIRLICLLFISYYLRHTLDIETIDKIVVLKEHAIQNQYFHRTAWAGSTGELSDVGEAKEALENEL